MVTAGIHAKAAAGIHRPGVALLQAVRGSRGLVLTA